MRRDERIRLSALERTAVLIPRALKASTGSKELGLRQSGRERGKERKKDDWDVSSERDAAHE